MRLTIKTKLNALLLVTMLAIILSDISVIQLPITLSRTSRRRSRTRYPSRPAFQIFSCS